MYLEESHRTLSFRMASKQVIMSCKLLKINQCS